MLQHALSWDVAEQCKRKDFAGLAVASVCPNQQESLKKEEDPRIMTSKDSIDS